MPPAKGYDDIDTETEESKSTHRPSQPGRTHAKVMGHVLLFSDTVSQSMHVVTLPWPYQPGHTHAQVMGHVFSLSYIVSQSCMLSLCNGHLSQGIHMHR